MIHKINTNNGIIANIYIREKNDKGEILSLIENDNTQPTVQTTAQPTVQTTAQSTVQTTAQSTVQTTAQPMAQPMTQTTAQPIIHHVNYMNIYDEVIQQLSSETAKDKWNSYLDFSHVLRNEWKIIHPKILEYIALRNKETVISTLNIANFEVTYEKKYAISAENVLREDVFSFVKDYYQSLLLQTKANDNYHFAHMELLSIMLQYELLPLLEHMTGENLSPKKTLVKKYTKGARVEPHTNEHIYIVCMSLSGPGNLKLNPKEIRNNYAGKYYTINDTYEDFCTKENGLLIYKGNYHIAQRTKMKKLYYYLELYYE